MKRKATRKIDLFFFEYESYYDENDDYIVHWEIEWTWLVVTVVVIVGLFFR